MIESDFIERCRVIFAPLKVILWQIISEKGMKTGWKPPTGRSGNTQRIEFAERKSRFIGSVQPCKTEEDALRFIEQKRKQYWDATHNVYAYILRNGGLKRCSDDGEPRERRDARFWMCWKRKDSPISV